ncbi:hypothetical protein FPV67DRAFT_1389873, partial [Lyophyllum atratum]
LRNSNLSGFRIPGVEEKLIANLFADDTTTFLSADDDFMSLQSLLDEWCAASTAKFNVKKTEIIPVGDVTFRRSVIDSRRTAADVQRIPDGLHIAAEGEAVRILGAWFGNGVRKEEPWDRILKKVDECLSRWEKGHPTLEGRKLIVQMMVGGMTQYLTQVQGMPKGVEKRLKKVIRRFVWNEKS